MHRSPSHALLAAALSVSGWTLPATASPSYPAEAKARLSLAQTPDCSLCHANGQTGFGTVTTPFGATLRSRGLVAENIGSLDAALAAITAEKKDSDGDGVSDVDELKAGSDPNVAGGGAVAGPSYGCFSSTGQPRSPLALVPLLAGAWWVRRRARRSRAPDGGPFLGSAPTSP